MYKLTINNEIELSEQKYSQSFTDHDESSDVDTTLHSTKNENPKESTLVIKEEDECTSLRAVAIETAQLSQAFSTALCRTAANNNKMAASREVVERELFGLEVLALDNNCSSVLPWLSARRESTPLQNKTK